MADRRGYSQTGIALLNAELAKRGIGPVGATGAIAGIMGESGGNLDPTSFNTQDPGGGSGGIGQWNRGRLIGQNGLLAFAQNAGVPVDVNNPLDATKVPLSVQAQYLGHELDTTYAGVRDQLKAAKSPQDALNVWVNSYEDPADKRAAIAQRTQYLQPVSNALSGTPAQPPATAAPAAAAPAVPGALAAGGGGVLPGFGTQASSDMFTKGLSGFDKAMGGQGVGQGQGQGQGQGRGGPQPSQMIPAPPAHIPMPYGQTLNSMANLLQSGGAPSGQGVGQMSPGQVSPIWGTSLNSLATLDQSTPTFPGMNPYGYGAGPYGYGGSYG